MDVSDSNSAPHITRRPWVAVLLALVAPIISMLYLGRGTRALGYLAAFVLVGVVATIGGAYFRPLSWIGYGVYIFGIFDSYRIAKQYREHFTGPWYSRWPGLTAIVLSSIMLVISIRAFLVEPFRMPAGSMLPTLHVGDIFLANKFAYGIRLPVTNQKIIDVGTPSLGDVVVFRFPKDTSINYIKRVVGLPGDRVIYKDKRLYINDQLMAQRDLRPYVLMESAQRVTAAKQLTEELGEVTHDILTTAKADYRAIEFVVPDNQYLVMGDNRDRSNDSRYWGYVPEENLVGKAFLVLWNEGINNKRRWRRIE